MTMDMGVPRRPDPLTESAGHELPDEATTPRQQAYRDLSPGRQRLWRLAMACEGRTLTAPAEGGAA